MALIINIDSSLENASVSLSQNGKILQLKNSNTPTNHAAFLHVAIKEMMGEAKFGFNEIDAVVCAVGPGSYTGLRVGLAAAKGFCFVLKIPLVTIGTLQAMTAEVISLQTDTLSALYCPMIDARRMEVFTATYNRDLAEIEPVRAVVLDDMFCEKLLHKQPVLFFGNGMAKFKNICKNKNAQFLTIDNWHQSINTIGYQNYCQQNFTNLHTAAPLYGKEFYNP